MARRPDQLAIELNAHRNAFKAFLAARVGSEAEAQDILQNGLLKALQGAARDLLRRLLPRRLPRLRLCQAGRFLANTL